MSLQLIAKEMEAKGRKGDSMLVHMTPGEVAGLQKLAESAGGSLSVNPDTGLVEANFLKQMLPTLVGAGVGFFTANPMLGAAAGAAVGGYQANRAGQDVGAGMVMGGLGGYGGASLGSSLQAAGAPATLGTEAAKQAGTGAASKTATNMATNAVMQQALSGGQQAAPAPTPFLTPAQQDMAAGSYGFGGDAPRLTTAGTGAGAPTVQVPLNTSAPDNVSAGAPTKFADMTYSQRLDQGLGGIKAFGTEEGRDKALKALGGSEGVMRMLMMSGLPAMYGARTQVTLTSVALQRAVRLPKRWQIVHSSLIPLQATSSATLTCRHLQPRHLQTWLALTAAAKALHPILTSLLRRRRLRTMRKDRRKRLL